MYGRDLVDAIMERNERRVKKLLKKTVDTDYVIKGDNAIHLAARYGLYKVIKYLLEYGEDVDKQNEYGNTALHYAAREGREDIVELLVKNGANINIQNHAGETGLHTCVGYQPMDVIERLVKMGMDVNIQTKSGDTPLHRAVEYSIEESIEALLLCEADPNIKNEGGKRPDQLAKKPSIGEQIRTHSLLASAMNSGYIQSQGIKLSHHDVASPLPIERVGIVIEHMDIPDDFPTTFYCRCEKSENSILKVDNAEDEHLISDVFVMRVREVYRDVEVKVTLPLYAKPTEKECLKAVFPLGKTGKIIADVFEKDEVFYCTVGLMLVPETTGAIVMCVSPKAETINVGIEETKLESEVDPEFSLQIPEGAFKENTEISLKVFNAIDESETDSKNDDSEDDEMKVDENVKHKVPSTTEEIEAETNQTNGGIFDSEYTKFNELGIKNQDADGLDQTSEIVEKYADTSNNASKDDKKQNKKRKRKRKKPKSTLLSDVYEIKLSGEQPSKGLMMQIPLRNGLTVNDDVQIVRIDDGDVNAIQALPIDATITEDGNVVFEASHFSMYVVIPRTRISTGSALNLSTVYEDVMNSKYRKQYARFFVMLKQLDVEDALGRHVLLVECIRAGSSKKRRKRWKKNGFEKQKPKNSGKLLLAPGQEFIVKLKGEAMFDRTMGETGSRKLVFSPHRASYQPYNIKLPPLYKSGGASVYIHTVNSGDDSKVNTSNGDSDNTVPLAKLKIQLNLPPEEEPFSEEIETLASYKTLAELRYEEQKHARKMELQKQKQVRKLEIQKQQRMAKKEQTLLQFQEELQNKGLESRPKSSNEASRFKTPNQINIDL